MKRLLLLFISLLMSSATITASEFHSDKKGKHLVKNKRYRHAQPIMFVERGVEFLVFPDGSFDFNTNVNNIQNYDYNKRLRGSNINLNHRGSYEYNRYTKNRKRSVSISHDRNGKVRRIGSVYLNYDRYGKIKRVGNVYMEYNRGNRSLKQVGGLHVNYNNWGEIVRTRGSVNGYDDYCNQCGIYSCDMNHSYTKKKHRHNNYYDDWDDDYNNYYYKKNGKVKKHSKRK
ncbi:hypothetical protein [Seonamhaeicola maritimus]|uniref:Uncharacterized protein n=1 Tax=Seonamhaeicola maritimus TaxID=2591822 RepID=A0A5C7GMN2_9FLAO|nr:hypothetical protein [Seonamhaeicola maritimus]TXG39776.1 hypothetical protein FUA22_07880 [Seonamhaeicola maritimus]